jgi:hypothetical protein
VHDPSRRRRPRRKLPPVPGPDDPRDLEPRVAALEGDVAGLRDQVTRASDDAAAARVLATGADHDVADIRAELRAHTQVLNALRETQLEQGRRLFGMEGRLDGVEGHLDGMELRMADGFATLGAGMRHITALLEGLTRGEPG